MRPKGSIWRKRLQQLIVESYLDGMVIGDILRLPAIAQHGPSEFTVRQILRANGIQPTGKRRKRNPEYWEPEIVDRIIELRNRGASIDEITRRIGKEYRGAAMSRSTVVRILDSSDDRISFRKKGSDSELPPETADEIVRMYQRGMLIKDIRESEVLRGYPVSSRHIRLLLKSRGIKLTGKKGMLRRWPDMLQRKIAALYETGATFAEIKEHPEIAANKPTDYAIRNILRKHGVSTRRGASYAVPISAVQFRRYFRGDLSKKKISRMHRRLAQADEEFERMLSQMGLHRADRLPEDDPRSAVARRNAESWRRLCKWAVRYLYDDALKRELCVLGYLYGERLGRLDRAVRGGDSSATERAWRAVGEACRELETAWRKLREPLMSCAIRRL